MLTAQFIARQFQACGDIHKETFASLMDLYENNYLRLKKLVPGLATIQGEWMSSVAGCLDLHVRVIEQSKYTSLISLSYVFDRNNQQVLEPDLKIRVYHDVTMAEVLSGELHHGQLKLENLPETAISERWHLNRFLYKWLGFCLHIGHQISAKSSSDKLIHQINQILSTKISS